MEEIIKEVLAEVKAQDKKWGDQHHPLWDLVLKSRGAALPPLRMAEEYEIPTANRAKQMTAAAARKDELTWMHILVEEVAEVNNARTTEEAVKELVQVAAVAIQAIKDLTTHKGIPYTNKN